MSEPEVYRQGRRLSTVAGGFSLPWSHPSSSLGLSSSKVLYLPKSRVLRVSSTLVYICRGGREGAISKKVGPASTPESKPAAGQAQGGHLMSEETGGHIQGFLPRLVCSA